MRALPLTADKPKKFANLRLVQKQFARRDRFMSKAIGLDVFVDVRVVKPDFVFFDSGKSIVDLRFAGAKRFDLRPVQHNARLVSFQDDVIAPGFGIVQDFGVFGHIQ